MRQLSTNDLMTKIKSIICQRTAFNNEKENTDRIVSNKKARHEKCVAIRTLSILDSCKVSFIG